MTISNTKAKSVYETNGERREWEIGFDFDSNVSKLNIILEDAEGYQTVVESNYVVEDNILTYPTLESELDPIAEGYKIIIFRSTPQTQETYLRDNVVEKGLDKLTLQVQELSEDLARAVKVPLAEEGVKEYQDLVLKVREERDTALEQIKEATSVVSDYTQASSASANIAKEEADRAVEASNTSVMASADAEASAIEAANLANEAKDAVSAYVNGLGAMRNAVIDLGLFEDNQRKSSSCIIDFDFEPLDVFIRFTDSSKNMWINGAHSFAGIEKVGYRKYKIFYSISSEDFASQSTIKGPFYVQYVIKYSVFSGKPVMYRGRVDTVDQLPAEAEDGDLWYVGPVEQSNKEEYIWQNGKWELLGSTDFTNIYTKEEIDNKVKVIESDIDANADAIQKTRSDFMEADSGLQQQIDALEEAVQGGGGGSAEIPDNVYTSDNLIAGKNVTFTEIPPEGGIDEHTLACWHCDEGTIDTVNSLELGDNVKTSTSYYKFGVSSAYNKTGYILNIANSLSASSDWTIDFWAKPSSNTVIVLGRGTYNSSYQAFGGANAKIYNNRVHVYRGYSSSGQEISLSRDSSTFTHYAFQRKSEYLELFVNGQKIIQQDVAGAGTDGNFGVSLIVNTANCYFDEIRISDTARYAEDFTPPTEPYKVATGPSKTAVNAIVAVPTKTSELENDSGFLTGLPEGIYTQTNLLGGKDIEIVPEPVEGGIDEHTLGVFHCETSSYNINAVEGGGSLKGSTFSTKTEYFKFGESSLYAGNSYPYYYMSTSKIKEESDWTVDGWIRLTGWSGTKASAGCGQSGSSFSWKVEISHDNNEAYIYYQNTSSIIKTSSYTIPANEWVHFAAEKDGNTINGYVNGVKIISYTDDSVKNTSSKRYPFLQAYEAYFDEIRFSTIARYKGQNFTPPTKAYEVAKPTGNYMVNFTGEAGGSNASFPLFYHTFADHILNDASWLRGDTFSWQSGDMYVSAYNHLVEDLEGITAEVETIGSTEITFYRANDGHKIVLADQESKVSDIYRASGVAWYYVLDTENKRFKLPRTKHAFTGLRNSVGNFVEAGLPNITGKFDANEHTYDQSNKCEGALYATASSYGNIPTGKDGKGLALNFDASRSSDVYGKSETAQPPATQTYLYFYVGNTVRNQTEVDVGTVTERLNEKLDLNLNNFNPNQNFKDMAIGWILPDYENYIEVTNIAANVFVQVEKDSFVLVFGSDPRVENYYAYVSPDGGTTKYMVGRRSDDHDSYTQATSFTFLVPAGWYFSNGAEAGSVAYVYPLRGAK